MTDNGNVFEMSWKGCVHVIKQTHLLNLNGFLSKNGPKKSYSVGAGRGGGGLEYDGRGVIVIFNET